MRFLSRVAQEPPGAWLLLPPIPVSATTVCGAAALACWCLAFVAALTPCPCGATAGTAGGPCGLRQGRYLDRLCQGVDWIRLRCRRGLRGRRFRRHRSDFGRRYRGRGGLSQDRGVRIIELSRDGGGLVRLRDCRRRLRCGMRRRPYRLGARRALHGLSRGAVGTVGVSTFGCRSAAVKAVLDRNRVP